MQSEAAVLSCGQMMTDWSKFNNASWRRCGAQLLGSGPWCASFWALQLWLSAVQWVLAAAALLLLY